MCVDVWIFADGCFTNTDYGLINRASMCVCLCTYIVIMLLKRHLSGREIFGLVSYFCFKKKFDFFLFFLFLDSRMCFQSQIHYFQTDWWTIGQDFDELNQRAYAEQYSEPYGLRSNGLQAVKASRHWHICQFTFP